MTVRNLSAKINAEVIPVIFDFTALIPSIDAIENVSIAVHSGVDVDASSMLFNTPTVDGAKCVQLVRGGNDGVTYLVSALVTYGQAKYQLSALLPVEIPK